MNTKICLRCGQEKSAKGFNLHAKYCKGMPKSDMVTQPKDFKLPAELPGLAATLGMMNEMQKQIQTNREMREAAATVDRQAEHPECPSCHCVGTETKVEYMEPCQTYRCGMCGFAYQRNMISGEYIYS